MSSLCHMISRLENSRQIRRHCAKFVLQSPNKEQEHRTLGGEDENVDRRMHGHGDGGGDSFVENASPPFQQQTGPQGHGLHATWSHGAPAFRNVNSGKRPFETVC